MGSSAISVGRLGAPKVPMLTCHVTMPRQHIRLQNGASQSQTRDQTIHVDEKINQKPQKPEPWRSLVFFISHSKSLKTPLHLFHRPGGSMHYYL